MSSTAIENSSELKKTPTNVSDAIKKLPALEQVAIQTYIAKLKSAMEDLEQEILRLQDGDDDGHAHYHGHEKCTHDHGHAHDHGEEGEKATESGHSHDHHHEKCTEDHDHGGHSHDHHHEKCTEDHDHGEHAHAHEHKNEHEHSHDHEKKEEDIPAWKKKAMAMDDDPMAAPFGGSWNMESSMDATTGSSGKVNETKSEKKEEDLPPLYESGDDFEKATNLKMEASDLKSSGDYEGALEKYTQAILAAEPSALLYANRADVLFRLKRYEACIRDCDEAVKKNPDSAKALRIRGKAKNMTGNLRDSLKDLSSSQTIDYDDDAAVMLKEVTKKVQEMDHEVVMKKVEEEEKMKKRAEEIKKAREEAEKEERERSAAAAGGGMPGMGGMDGGMPGMGGMDGGMPGMGGAGGPGGSMPGGMGGLMAALMSDPELAAGMQNPKVMAAFQDLMSSPGGAMGLMSDPSKLQKLMEDPEVGPFLQKLMGKLGPMMGGMGGGMPPGGMGGGMPPGGTGGGMDDDIPDLDDLPDLE